MMQLLIDEGTVTPYERHALSLSQVLVLCAFRHFRTRQRVANFLRKEEKAVEMVLLRIRKKGIAV